MDASALIASLRSHGVKSFTGYGISVEFHLEHSLATIQASPVIPTQTIIPTAPVPTMDLPGTPQESFTGDDLMNFDKIRDWSATPDPTDRSETPLTGDGPIDDGAA